MGFHQWPEAQGLYRPGFEHDACGIGLYAHMKGTASHDVVINGLKILRQLDHRGGKNGNTGDGSGLMTEIPDRFFRNACGDWKLPEKGRYGVGMIFFDREGDIRKLEKEIESVIEEEGQILIGWRTVPVDEGVLEGRARETRPAIRQVFIGAGAGCEDPSGFERKLYVIRRRAEKLGKAGKRKRFYFSSLSSRTIVYKGLLTPEQLGAFYLDIRDPRFESSFALVHSRFSTNTFPSWERAHPNRFLLHNGEINTLQGNVQWMRARERKLAEDGFGEDAEKVLPVLDTDGSDSSILDNAFEFLVMAGLSPAHAAMVLVPEAWERDPGMTEKKRAFYRYHSLLMEPWDGPAAILFTDGRQIGAILDRNGLRPGRYWVTTDDHIIFSSEAGVIELPPEKILYKERLSPGRMLLIDLEEGRIVPDGEIKETLAGRFPYQRWLDSGLIRLEQGTEEPESLPSLRTLQRAFGYTYEEIHKYLLPLAVEKKDPVGSMGYDAPLAVLSGRPQSLFNYFKQLFAQVTNPPIDPIREQMVTSTVTYLGKEGHLLKPGRKNCARIQLDTPVLTNGQLARLKENRIPGFKSRCISAVFTGSLEKRLAEMAEEAEQAVKEGADLLILSDRDTDETKVPVPALLAVSSVHHHLLKRGLRLETSLIAESGEVREVHHFAALIGYGADAVNPYLAFATYFALIKEGTLPFSYEEAVKRYVRAVTDGIVKVMAKMGISTVQSYRGAQIFEAVGISDEVIGRYFPGTPSQIGGIGLDVIEKEARLRHESAFQSPERPLEPGSDFQWRESGEDHAFHPKAIYTLQWAVRKGDYGLYKEFSKAANDGLRFIRHLFEFAPKGEPIPVDEVEPEEKILRRFKTGAMSFGSLSKEAHETLAIAMNRLGGKSNSGEGGEDPERYLPDESGDRRVSKIKQIASGRFGVSSHYLVNAEELQIKMAQGAKPGEGGQLPGKKVYPWVAKVRGSTPGVGLISPPPNHDIYSIEDLAQLIFDLKNANRNARISVKLVAKAGVGTIAAGVAKAKADVIVISGHDGGTGASPKTSIKHAGLPWELGLAEAQQTLILNGLRDRVVLETDGKLMTGRDVVIAALLGAEEFSFGTAPLVALGCIMMRACHSDTCPVGIATQNPALREKFAGKPEYVMNFFRFVAREVREIMAELGFRTVDEMVGRTDVLRVSPRAKEHWKAKFLEVERLLHRPGENRRFSRLQDHQLERTLDWQKLLPQVKPALEGKTRVRLTLPIRNTDRAAGTLIGSEISKRYGENGLPDDTITVRFRGSAGQSFGAFLPKGITLFVEGDVNDYLGKGLSGGKLIVKGAGLSFAGEDVVAGNVALYGAIGGEVYINGRAGERFAVRNSGATAVVEGIGNHGCEYMTGGRVIILGDVGKNFAAGMSGGIAWVFPENPDEFLANCNTEMADAEPLDDPEEIEEVRRLLHNHWKYTGSRKAAAVLRNWKEWQDRWVKVIPREYKKILRQMEIRRKAGAGEEEALYQAFLSVHGKEREANMAGGARNG
nr:glutamate synthase large subunit [Bacillaceae bacterium]